MATKPKKDMPFLAHIGELRGHLVRAILAIVVTSIAVACFC